MDTKQMQSRSLVEAFGSVPDPRSAKGKRHSLAEVLAIATAAMLCGARSLYAIAQWGRDQEPELLKALGLGYKQSPCVATFHRVFVKLDAAAFEQALARWAERNLAEGSGAIAVDGKSLRGIHGEQLPGVHLVAAYTHTAGLVLGQSGGQGQRKGG